MGIIGSSNNNSLWEKLGETTLTSIPYPKNQGPLVESKAWASGMSTTFQASVVSPVQHRVDDVVRISKLLAKAQGVKWEMHTAELQTMQTNLERKRQQPLGLGRENPGFWKSVGQTFVAAGKSLLTGISMTASTLAQVGLSGTGEHQTPYQSRGYLVKTPGAKRNFGTDLLGSLGFGDGVHVNGASYALKGATVPTYVGFSRLEDNQDNSAFNKTIQELMTVQQFQGESTIYEDSLETLIPKAEYGWDKDVKRSKAELKSHLSKISEGERKRRVESEDNAYYLVEGGEVDFTRGIESPETLEESNKKARVVVENATTTESRKARELEKEKKFSGIRNQKYNSISEENLGKKQKYENTLESVKVSEANSHLISNNPDVIESRSVYRILSTKSGGEARSRRFNDNIEYVRYGAELPGEPEDFNLIPFNIELQTPEKRCRLYFQANLDSYSDDYVGNWTGMQYVGRADKMYTYEGFDRNIKFSFKVIAWHPEDLEPMYKHLNLLVGATAPSYNLGGVFMRGTFAKITIGDLLRDQRGFIGSVGISWETDVPWSTGKISSGNIDEKIMVPHMLNVSVGFTPIHDFVPENDSIRYFGVR